ncbi:hypothetical protein [Empedobacter sp.]|uniref:hypothetical protein n=1 Tax=Empedobacter sp. TaxID=1927715 RepID=UPI00289F8B91|nr:hypothetical protein [Empedobacter sp.]
MGVDYRANFGIGFKIKADIDENDELDIREYLDELIDKSKYSWFEVGDEGYTGDENDYYVVLDELKPIATLEQRVEELRQHLLSEHFIIDSEEFDLVGGLEVY